jgi:hypothetical protein
VTSLSCSTVPPRWSSSTAISVPFLRPARPERFAARLLVDPDVSRSSKVLLFHTLSLSFTLSLSHQWGDNSWSGRCSPTSDSSYPNAAFFLFRGGRPLHKVHFSIFRNATGDPAALFPKPSLLVFPKTSLLLFLIVSSRGCSLLLRPPILLAAFLLFLGCSSSSTCQLLVPLLRSFF